MPELYHNGIEDISAKGAAVPSVHMQQAKPLSTRPKLYPLFFIPRCFGIKSIWGGSIVLIIVAIFIGSAIGIIATEAKDEIMATPVPRNVPLRKSLPNIP